MTESPPAGGELAYLILKTAHGMFQHGLRDLDAAARRRVEELARRQHALEALVLSAPEARDVMVPEVTLEKAFGEIRGRYPDEVDFLNDLADNGLKPASLRQALARELKVEAVLDKEAARAARVSDIDVELYYHYHPEQFARPEIRRARHILITINEDLPENTRPKARARIEAIAARLAREPGRFEEQALKHSECPTAMNGGLLGDARAGQLYPELDALLFTLAPGQIGPVTESPLGFHLLLCENIQPAGAIPLNRVKPKIREMLEARRRKICQSAWVKRLSRAGEPTPSRQ